MDAERTCSRCGSSSLESGKVQSTGRMHFHFSKARFFTTYTSYVPIISIMCLDCGKIELIGEVSKARKITKKE